MLFCILVVTDILWRHVTHRPFSIPELEATPFMLQPYRVLSKWLLKSLRQSKIRISWSECTPERMQNQGTNLVMQLQFWNQFILSIIEILISLFSSQVQTSRVSLRHVLEHTKERWFRHPFTPGLKVWPLGGCQIVVRVQQLWHQA